MSAPTPDAAGAEQIGELRRLLDAATPGPWSFYSDDLWAGVTADELQRADAIYATGVAFSDEAEDVFERSDHVFHGDPVKPADAEFIAAARNSLPVLLAEIDRLRAELAAAQEREARVRAETHVEDDEPIAPPSECACWVEGWDHAIGEMWRRLRAALADPAPSGKTP